MKTAWISWLEVPGTRYAAGSDDMKTALFVNVDRDIRGVIGYSAPGMIATEAQLQKAVEQNVLFQTYDDTPDPLLNADFSRLEALAKAQ